ncbi:lipopolysaccharide assembly protein LapB [Roseivirga sp. E12]|uniref:tetratricopeptide repeat protein n=1 Tax=Roseivirga sp. E12 TaxID=2819237 RepID=UPI001ABD1D14|nr:tetratricopeptide repeat protein [Roseivirga sp. E12]MBO3699174.1 tetratricopeptide repeat protein [Roseivirga sp. E12]
MKSILILIFTCLVMVSCQQQPKTVAQKSDYNNLLIPTETASSDLNEDIEFWQERLLNSPKNYMNYSQLAGLYSKRFRADGFIDDIHTSDSLFLASLALNPFNKAATFRSLSANAVTKHEFEQAKSYALKALAEGEDKAASYYILFDALMELGEFESAEGILNIQKSKNSFDYLTRASKFADHQGDLDLAIALMEQAYDRVKFDKSTMGWSVSNLGDMYGHAGRIEDSYQAYLKVLEADPQHWHSWKGMAWINFAHDKNISEAKRILRHIEKLGNDPQVKLMLAEIADYEGLGSESLQLKQAFFEQASSPKYMGMHNKYLILLAAEDLSMKAQAIEDAEREQEKRPTPQMYDLLAWAYLQNGDMEKALKVASLFVEGQSSEPEVLYHLGVIYKMNGQDGKGDKYLKEALESAYELGPLTTKHIKENLKS